jgi:hypothetical protein
LSDVGAYKDSMMLGGLAMGICESANFNLQAIAKLQIRTARDTVACLPIETVIEKRNS